MNNRTDRSRPRTAAAIIGVVVAAVLIASCSSGSSTSTTTQSGSSSTPTSGGGSATQGVSSNQISVGSIASLTGAISADFAAFVPGIRAYLDTVNAHGGVTNGGVTRKVVLTANLDDAGTSFNQLSHTLIQQDKVFAAFISTFFFTPGLFVQTGIPTFGYNTSGNWTPAPNLFGAGGSTQDYNYGGQGIAYLMKQLHAKSAAVISYGPAITSSYDACHTAAQKLQAAGVHVVYTNLDESLSGDYTPAVQRMQQAGADFVWTCMQSSDNVTLARAIKQYGLNIHQLWFSGYDDALLSQYSDLMQNVYLGLNGNVPFQVATAYPGKYPGMDQYLAAMNRYSPKDTYSLLALQGWQSAALLVEGIKRAGPNLTWSNVINQINQITNFNAGGVSTVVDWTKLHTVAQTSFPGCSAFVKVAGMKFVPAVAKGPQTIVCFAKDTNLKDPVLATPPAGTPGT